MQKIRRALSKVFLKRGTKTAVLETEIRNIHPRTSILDSILEANERFIEALMSSMNVPMRRD